MNTQTGKQRFITYLTVGADVILKVYELLWKLSKVTEVFLLYAYASTFRLVCLSAQSLVLACTMVP